MAIREELVLDTRKYMSSLNEADRAAVKMADKQEAAYKNASRQMDQLSSDIKKLAILRDKANSPEAVKRYERAIESLEKEYNDLEREVREYGLAADRIHSNSTRSVVKNQREVEQSQGRVAQGFQKIGASAKLWLGSAVLGGLFLVKQTLSELSREQINFDKKFNESIAIQQTNGVNISIEQQDRMKKAARETARELNISTDKVAEGYFFLASAGLNVEQQIANIGTVSRFAKAGQFDLATATDLLTDAQSALGLTTTDVVENQKNMIRVSDVLAKANTTANATIEQLSESLTNKAGTALKNYNKEIEEGVAILSAYADQGLKGRLAGERFSILFKRLSESALNNAEAFRENNVAVFDSEGRYRNIADIIQDLEIALEGLSDEQRASTLAQLGFTAETQDAILPLIGLSNKIREYESALKSAGGTTDDIANNQLNNLTDRIGLMFRKLNDQFGPALLGWIEEGVGLAEKLVNRLDKVFSSDLDVLIRNLKEFGGNEDLIIKLQAQSDLQRTVDIKEKLEKELGELEVPVNIVGRGGVEKTFDALTSTIKNTLSGFKDALSGEFDISKFGLLGTINGVSDALQDLEFTTVDFDIKKLDEYKTKVVFLEESWNELNKAALELQEKGADTSAITAQSDKLYEQINIYDQMIIKAETLQAQEEIIATLRGEMAKGNFQAPDGTGESSGVIKEISEQEKAIKKVEQALEDYKSAMRDLKFDKNTLGLSDEFVKESQDDFANSINKRLKSIFNEFLESGGVITEELQKAFQTAFDSFDLPETTEPALERLSSIIDTYNNELTTLQNKLNTGDLSESEFLKSSTQATEAFQKELKELYVELSATGKLTPELEKMFSTLWKKTAKDTKDVKNNFDDIADSISGILSVADAFGKIDDNLKNVLRGSIDLFKNLQNIRDLDGSGLLGLGGTGLAGALPVLGIAGGIGSIISSLFNDNNDDEQRKELERTIHEQIIALEKNTQALLRSSVVGGDTRAEDVDRVIDIIKSLGRNEIIFGGGGGVGTIFRPGVTEDEAVKLLQELESLFPEFFNGITQDFIRRVNRDGLSDALKSFQLLIQNRFEDFANNFGDYGESIDGAIQAFRDAISFGAIDSQNALSAFISTIKELGTDIPAELLNQIKDLDLSSEEGKKALDEIIKQLFDGQFLGDLSPDEYRNLLNFLQDLGSDSINESGSVVRSVSAVPTITELQTNSLLVLEEGVLFGVNALNETQRMALERLTSIDNFLLSVQGTPGAASGLGSITNNISVQRPFTSEDFDQLMNSIRISLEDEYLNRA